MAVEKLKLNDGYEMPCYGLGTMFVSSSNMLTQNVNAEIDFLQAREDVGIQAIKDAIDLGYRHFDTAHLYSNEKQVGDGIRAKIADGTVKREDVFVVTKVTFFFTLPNSQIEITQFRNIHMQLWNTYHEPDKVEQACRNSCDKLGLGYIDLYLMHSPMGFVYHGDTEADLFPKDSEGTVLFK